MQKYIIILLLGLLLIHCATTTESTFDDEQATTFDNASTAYSPQGSGGGFGVSINGPSSIDGNFGGAGTCYSDEVKQETNTVNLVFLLDRSASMSGWMWDSSINELEKFINDPKSSGINVALSYFPAIPFDAHCDEKLYESPHIPFGVLPSNSSELVTSLKNTVPDGGGTPLYGGMSGTYSWLVPYAIQLKGEQTLLIIVSDGSPNTCGYSYDTKEELANLAATAFQSGVKTATIGLTGANLTTLGEIAKSGGTDMVINITYDPTALYETLNIIRNGFQCEYVFDKSQVFDPGQWFVQYLSSNGFPDWIIPRVSDKTECSTVHGWYYDNNSSPTTLTLCPKPCEIVTFDDNFTLQLAFGCPADHGIIK